MNNNEMAVSFKTKFGEIFSKFGIYIIFLGMVIALTIISPVFLTYGNIINIVRQMSVVGTIAVGMTIIIITGGIDLSPGSVVALVAVVAASFAHPGEYSLLITLFAGAGAGLLAGFINGSLISATGIPPFIVTLGMMTAARGVALLYSGGRPIGNLSDSFRFLGSGYIFGIPVPIIIFAIVALIGHIILNKTTFGKSIYAVGGNEEAAVVCGVNVKKVKLFVYTFGGLTAAIAGMVLTARVSAGSPSSGLSYELDAIAATIIGGTSFNGGVGTITGTIIGALILGTLNNGLDLIGVSSYWQQISKGVIIVGAIILDSLKND